MKREVKVKVLYGSLDEQFTSINEEIRRFVGCLNDDPFAVDLAISAPSLVVKDGRIFAAVTVTWVATN